MAAALTAVAAVTDSQYLYGEAAKWDSKGFINPLAEGERGVTPYSVGRCHEVTEGTGDRWEQRPPKKAVNQAQR